MPNWEINVSKDGTHLFATHPRSITTRHELEHVWRKLQIAFTKEEGYRISASYCTALSEEVDLDKMFG